MKQLEHLMAVTRELADSLDQLTFGHPVAITYNVLRHAWASHCAYLKKFGQGGKRVLFLGMNPGPWGMVQTGVPFGEVSAVRDWMHINEPIEKPSLEHPKRPVIGFGCGRSEISGKRLWALFQKTFGEADVFFEDHFVLNYCPLAFMEESGRNLTPDKLPSKEALPLQQACDRYLSEAVRLLSPNWVIGIGAYGEQRAKVALGTNYRIGRILHPSPASPAANSGWAEKAEKQLKELGVWS